MLMIPLPYKTHKQHRNLVWAKVDFDNVQQLKGTQFSNQQQYIKQMWILIISLRGGTCTTFLVIFVL